jgi:hypothetical protein
MGLTDLEKMCGKQTPQRAYWPGARHDFPHPALPVDNFVDNAVESRLSLAMKTPKRPESAKKWKIKPFKNNGLKNRARGGSNPDFFLPSVHKCRAGTFLLQSCCTLQNRRRIDRASLGGGDAQHSPERDSYPQGLLITLWTIASPWYAGIQ